MFEPSPPAIFVVDATNGALCFANAEAGSIFGSMSLGIASLANVPVGTLKLERSLVEGMTVSRTTHAVVEGSIIVARSLGWGVLAEGVETACRSDARARLGCIGALVERLA